MLTLTRTWVVIIVMLPSVLYAFCFEEAEQRFGIDRRLLESIAMAESNMNSMAVHVNGDGSFDAGLMQINSSWIGALGLDKEKLVADACYNVMAGARILSGCLERYGYRWEAVGCYNAASMRKRIDYSWKVYRILREKRKTPGAPQGPGSSFVFEVRDSVQK